MEQNKQICTKKNFKKDVNGILQDLELNWCEQNDKDF